MRRTRNLAFAFLLLSFGVAHYVARVNPCQQPDGGCNMGTQCPDDDCGCGDGGLCVPVPGTLMNR